MLIGLSIKMMIHEEIGKYRRIEYLLWEIKIDWLINHSSKICNMPFWFSLWYFTNYSVTRRFIESHIFTFKTIRSKTLFILSRLWEIRPLKITCTVGSSDSLNCKIRENIFGLLSVLILMCLFNACWKA